MGPLLPRPSLAAAARYPREVTADTVWAYHGFALSAAGQCQRSFLASIVRAA